MFALPVVLLACTWAAAQQNNIPLNRDIYYDIDRNGSLPGSTMHTGMRPIIQSRADLTNVMGFRPDSGRYYYWITEKLFKESLIKVSEGDFNLTADPVFRFEVGKDLRDRSDHAQDHLMTHNGRGFRLAADLGPTVSFQTTFYENQATLTNYLFRYAQTYGVVPGQGRIKMFNERGLDFAWVAGNVSWSPRPWLNAQLGQGRHFVGNGYRSMLLSDNTMPYPYVKLSGLTGNNRFQYTAIFAKLQQIGPSNRLPTTGIGETLFWWKRATFIHVSANLGPLQLGLFEGTMWKTIRKGKVQPLNLMMLNPVIGLNTAINGFDGRHTQVLGLDAKLRLRDKFFAYGQFALTDPGRDRYAWQVGAQVFDLLRRDLHLLAEYNRATPFAYTKADPRMSWTNAGQPMASPLGSDFSELVVRADYGIKQRFWLGGEFSLAKHPWGDGATEVAGGDIFGPTLPEGPPGTMRQRVYGGANISWRMNQMTNMQLTMGYTTRLVEPGLGPVNSGQVFIAFHTGLFNRYYDI